MLPILFAGFAYSFPALFQEVWNQLSYFRLDLCVKAKEL